jgi:Uma2 family endonuclease
MAEITTPRPDRSATGTLAPPRRFTVDEYLQMTESGILTEDDAVELIHGQIVEMSPKNSPHRVCVAKINQTLVRQLADATYCVQTQSTLPLDDRNAPEPDLAVLRGTPDDLMQGELPVALVIEVADTSLERDRTVKQRLYAQAGIPAYWIVNLAARELEMFSDPRGERYRERTTRPEPAAVDVPVTPPVSVDVQDLLPATRDEGESR